MAIIGRQQAGQFGLTLIVNDVAAAADFYRDVLGAEEVARSFAPNPVEAPSSVAVSAELRLAGTYLMLCRENPRWREAPRPDWPRSPLSAGAASAFMVLYVEDVEAVYARALARGARPTRPDSVPEETYWGDRLVQFHDPLGHVWRVMTRIEDVAPADLAPRLEAALDAHRVARAAG